MSGWKSWAANEVVQATDFQGYVQDQVVQVYTNSGARGSALGTAVSAGMISYLTASTAIEYYNGSAWVSVSNPGDITAVTAGTGLTGGGSSGAVTLDVNLGSIFASPTLTGTATLAAGSVTGNLVVSGTATFSANTSFGSVTSTELSYLDGVTSAIQTQLNDRVLRNNGTVSTATAGSAVVRNITLSTATPGTATGQDGDVWLVYTP